VVVGGVGEAGRDAGEVEQAFERVASLGGVDIDEV
jgi:hypothetical protein